MRSGRMGYRQARIGERIGAQVARIAFVLLAGLLLANCTAHQRTARVDPQYGVAASPRVVADGTAIPRGGGHYRVGDPYTIAGRTYVPRENPNYRAEGVASWYGSAFHGRLTSNGEVFDQNAISAAHPTLPLPSYVRVTHLANRRSIVVRLNDRGPFHDGRVIDLSARSAELLGFRGNGLARVRVEYVGRASLAGSDDHRLLATLRRDGSPAPAVQVASAAPEAPHVAPRDTPQRTPPPVAVASVDERVRLISAQATMPQTGFVQAARPAAQGFAPVASQTSAVLSGRGLY
jgi:rare lipoprotein A